MTLEMKLIKQIHIGKGQLVRKGIITEADYRAMLAGYGVESSTGLDRTDAIDLMQRMEKLGWDRRMGVDWDPRIRKAWAMWQKVARAEKKYAAFVTFCRRFGTTPGRARRDKASAVLEAVKRMAARNNTKAQSHEDTREQKTAEAQSAQRGE